MLKITDNADGAWLSLYYLSFYLSYRFYKKRDFIDLKVISERVIKGLNMNKEILINTNDYGGNQFKDGLWGDVIRLTSILNEKYGSEILNIDELSF